MPLLRPISPKALLDAHLRAGYKLIDEGADNWVLAAGDNDPPVFVPKKGKYVSVDIMSQAQKRGFGTPLVRELLEEVRKQSSAPDDDDDDDGSGP